MADRRHVPYRRFWSWVDNGSSDFRKILYDDNNHGRLLQIANFENFKWRTSAILKIAISPYFGDITDFDEILYAVADWIYNATYHQNLKFLNQLSRTDALL